MKRNKASSLKLKIIVAGLFLSTLNAVAQNTPPQPARPASIFSGAGFYVMAVGFLILLIVIYGLGKTAIGLSNAVSNHNKK